MCASVCEYVYKVALYPMNSINVLVYGSHFLIDPCINMPCIYDTIYQQNRLRVFFGLSVGRLVGRLVDQPSKSLSAARACYAVWQ